MDDETRYGVSASDMLFCKDMSDTISQHLQNSVIRSQRQWSGRLIQALSTFNGSQGSLRDWWLRQDNLTARRGGRYASTDLDIVEQKGRLDEDFGIQESNLDQLIDASEAIRATMQRNKSGAAGQESGMTADERTQEGIAGKDSSHHGGVTNGGIVSIGQSSAGCTPSRRLCMLHNGPV